MSDANNANAIWLTVIARSLAYLSLSRAQEVKPAEFESVLAKVKFLRDLGLPEADAARVAGSNPNSVAVMTARKKRKAASGRKKR